MNGIKGASAHSINHALARRGPVWQDESFDHVVRSSGEFSDLELYIFFNPVRAGLVKLAADYRWLWNDA